MTNNTNIEVNNEALQPNEYFKILKSKLKKSTKDKLTAQLNALGEQILNAKKVGQKNFLEQLSFCYDVVIKEQLLLANGYEDYVYKDDVKEFLDKVKPDNSIKIIELSRFPRSIPSENLKKIEEAQNLNIFDDFVVVFTDLTENDYKTEEEKKYVAKNRDPIVLGYFKDAKTTIQHERFYFITDWEDDYCELTFDKMIEKMTNLNINKPHNKISIDHNYLTKVVNDVMGKQKVEQQSFWKRLCRLVKK